MPVEALIKPLIDALLAALEKAKGSALKRSARRQLGEAIKELVKLDPDIDAAEAKIAIAKAAGIIERDIFTAEKMLATVKRASHKRIRGGKPLAKPRRARKAPARKK